MTRTLFSGARILDGTGAAPAEADLVIEDGRIVEIGRGLDGEERIDLAGKAVLPGLFDCHTHVVVSSIDTMRLLQTPFSYRFFQAARNLEATLRIGITTVRDAGGADLGGKQAGADVIKVAVSGGVLSPRDKPTHAHFRVEELEVLVEEANAAGIFVMAHAQAAPGIKNAIRAGIRSIDHGIYLDDEAIEMMLARGTWLVPTLVAPRGVIDAADAGAAIPETSVAKAREVVETHRASFAKAVAAGVKVAMCTDSGVTPHGENLRELQLMVEGGMTPMQAIEATTRSAAELMGLEEELGTLEVGKRADLVIVEGNPLEVATLAERVVEVYQDGVKV